MAKVMAKSWQIAKLKQRFDKLLADGKLKVKDLQEIDFEAYVDETLTYEENLNALLGMFYIPEPVFSPSADKAHLLEVENHYEREFKESVSRLKGGEQDSYFEDLRHYVSMVAGGFANSLIVEGRGGIGKTFEVLKTLNELGVEYEYISSYSTPLEFYQLIYEQNGKVIVLDDFEGVLNSDSGLSLLKSCLWSATDKRIVSYLTTSSKLTVPNKFEFTGRIIFCLNHLHDNPELEAFKSRALYFKLDFSIEDIKKMMMAIAKSDSDNKLELEEREQVAQFIIDEADEATKELNFRTLVKAFGIFSYAKKAGIEWKGLVSKLLDIDEDKKLVKELVDKHTEVKDAAAEFCDITGKSRRTFFLLKKEMGLSRDWVKR